MKKQLITLLLVLGLVVSAKGIDPFCIKEGHPEILNDHKWHTLTFVTFGYRGRNILEVAIRQKATCVDYEFKNIDNTEKNVNAVYEFSIYLRDSIEYWSNYYYDPEDGIIGDIVEDGQNCLGSFHGIYFVPKIANEKNFIGIDI